MLAGALRVFCVSLTGERFLFIVVVVVAVDDAVVSAVKPHRRSSSWDAFRVLLRFAQGLNKLPVNQPPLLPSLVAAPPLIPFPLTPHFPPAVSLHRTTPPAVAALNTTKRRPSSPPRPRHRAPRRKPTRPSGRNRTTTRVRLLAPRPSPSSTATTDTGWSRRRRRPARPATACHRYAPYVGTRSGWAGRGCADRRVGDGGGGDVCIYSGIFLVVSRRQNESVRELDLRRPCGVCSPKVR